MVREDAENVVHPNAKDQVRDDILQEDNRRRQTVEHLHLSVDEQAGNALDVLARHGHAASEQGTYRAVLRQEGFQRADDPVLGGGVGVFVGVGHARIEMKILITSGIGAHMVANPGDAVMRGAHEGANALVVGDIDDFDDRPDVLELHGLGAGALLGHVIDAEKLIVPEKNFL